MLLSEAKEILKKNGYIIEAMIRLKRETTVPSWYRKEKCDICGEPATHRILHPYGNGQYDSWDYYCDKCADEMSM